MVSKLKQAAEKLEQAKNMYDEQVAKEKGKFGDIAERLEIVEMTDNDITVALMYFEHASKEEQQKMYEAVLPKLPTRFQAKIKKSISEVKEAP
ncbi:hypothetical protein MTBPR1_80200 [Candidatus Terasakiella magnetica]|uniref:Uncharacterized protein n=1 Tax=Candidatus Terasakiella magnetica TaxID=1867952 RepID=A0A1C3RLI5_9PROT|nr:hypothetical protein [Candidatus Terasakiella magnetica]SCA58146.1 hypothetical protein MTBPR1_80200 [Candidatus Terasakiella magnetica]